MIRKHLDEYLTPKLRNRIEKLIDLDLDERTIMSLLSNDFLNFEDYMLNEINRFTKYLIWLKENNKSRNSAYAKYKKQTGQNEGSWSTLKQVNDIKSREYLIQQRRKEQERYDEISKSLVRHGYNEFKFENDLIKNLDDINNLQSKNNIDSIVIDDNKFIDLDIDNNIQEFEKNEKQKQIYKNNLEDTLSDLYDILEKPLDEDAYGDEHTLSFDDKVNLFENESQLFGLNDAKFSQTLKDANLFDENTSNIQNEMILENQEAEEVTMDEIISQSNAEDANLFSNIDEEAILDDEILSEEIISLNADFDDLDQEKDELKIDDDAIIDESTTVNALNFLEDLKNKYNISDKLDETLNVENKTEYFQEDTDLVSTMDALNFISKIKKEYSDNENTLNKIKDFELEHSSHKDVLIEEETIKDEDPDLVSTMDAFNFLGKIKKEYGESLSVDELDLEIKDLENIDKKHEDEDPDLVSTMDAFNFLGKIKKEYEEENILLADLKDLDED